MSLTEAEREKVLEIVQSHGTQPTRLVQILRDVQECVRCVPSAAVEMLAAELKVPRTQVQGVAEFYSFLSLEPQGRYHVLISDSISDHMLGSRELAGYLSAKLGVEPGQTRADGRISLGFTSCTGLCDQGPAGLVNGRWLPHLDEARVDRIASLIEKDVPLDEWPQDLFAVEDNIRKPGLLLEQPLSGQVLRWQKPWNRGSALPSRMSMYPACAGGAGRVSRLPGNGNCALKGMTAWPCVRWTSTKENSVMWCATPTRANPAHSRIECY